MTGTHPAVCVLTLLMIGIFPAWGTTRVDWHIREEKVVDVDGVEEVWQLRWLSRPHGNCGPADADTSLTCPCSGFAYGMKGRMALVRKRPGHADERLDLGTLFPEEYPNNLDRNSPGEVTIQQWAPIQQGADTDWQHAGDPDFVRRVRARPVVELMHPADYDHDGRATEFLIQVGTLPCGKHQMVLVGLSRRNPHLHAFTTAENPDRPLVLAEREWAALLDADGHATEVDWPCGDHASEVEWIMDMEASDGILHARNRGYACSTDGTRGNLVNTQVR